MQMVFECVKGWRTGRTRYVRMLCLLTYELILNCEIEIINRERVARISVFGWKWRELSMTIFYSSSFLSHRTKTHSDIETS